MTVVTQGSGMAIGTFLIQRCEVRWIKRPLRAGKLHGIAIIRNATKWCVMRHLTKYVILSEAKNPTGRGFWRPVTANISTGS